MKHQGLKVYQIYTNDNLGLILAYFKARPNILTFCWVVSEFTSRQQLRSYEDGTSVFRSLVYKASGLATTLRRLLKHTLYYAYNMPRCQMSVYRTTGSLVYSCCYI